MMIDDHRGDPDRDVRIHRALSSSVRRRLLEVLEGSDGDDVRSLADRLELHVNTVRTHLAVLEDAGLVISEAEERDRPGRPKLLYRTTGASLGRDSGDGGGYRFLAAVLASYLASSEQDPAGAAERAGTAWGHYLVDRPAPFQSVDPGTALTRVVGLLQEFGFAPELDVQAPSQPQVFLHRCPFLEVAKEHQDIVCSIHLGLMRGALDELGAEVEATDLIPWVDPDRCVSRFELPA